MESSAFYAQKYDNALPSIKEELFDGYFSIDDSLNMAYDTRFFARFTEWFGFTIVSDQKVEILQPKDYQRAECFANIFEFR
jgi:hypothetical protein